MYDNIGSGIVAGAFLVFGVIVALIRDFYVDKLEAAIEPVCSTCNGHGLVGGFVNMHSGYEDHPCPDCSKYGEPVGYVRRDVSTAELFVNLPEGTPLYTAPYDGLLPIETAPKDEDVLVYSSEFGSFHVALTCDDDNRWFTYFGEPVFGVTHWLPLPAPPKSLQEVK